MFIICLAYRRGYQILSIGKLPRLHKKLQLTHSQFLPTIMGGKQVLYNNYKLIDTTTIIMGICCSAVYNHEKVSYVIKAYVVLD